MKIINNDENLDIRINREIVVGERKIQNRVKKEVKKEGLKNRKQIWKRKKKLRRYKNKEKTKNEKIYNGPWESTLLFKARADSLEVNEKGRKWGGEKDTCEKCEIKRERNTGTLEHVLIANALSIKRKEKNSKHK